jgi:hypothetical protein
MNADDVDDASSPPSLSSVVRRMRRTRDAAASRFDLRLAYELLTRVSTVNSLVSLFCFFVPLSLSLFNDPIRFAPRL